MHGETLKIEKSNYPIMKTVKTRQHNFYCTTYCNIFRT